MQHQAIRGDLARYRRAYSVFVAAVLVCLFALLSTSPALNIGALTLAAACFAYVFYASNRVQDRAIPCPSCAQMEEAARTPIDQPWVCGFCHTTHTYVLYPTRRTFCEHCQNPLCRKLPISLICWRCREPVIFNDAGFRPEQATSAWLPDYPPLPPPPPPPPPELPPDELPAKLDEDLI